MDKVLHVGNTVDTLRGTDVNDAARAAKENQAAQVQEDLDKEAEIAKAAAEAIEADPELKAELEQSYVSASDSGPIGPPSREEFNELLLLLTDLIERVERFNTRSGHKI